MRTLALAFLLANAALSAQEAARPLPCDTCVAGVENFAEVSEALWRGAQPTAEGFRALERRGARTVVNLRHGHDDLELLRGTRLKYLRIPSRAYHPTEAHVLAFLKVLEDPGNWPVFVHCAQGRDRTGYNVAAYRVVVQGWRAEEALREMDAFHFNPIWAGNPGFVRRLDPGKLRAKLRTVPAPALLSAPPSGGPPTGGPP